MSNLFKISIYIFDLIYLINISVASRLQRDHEFFAGIDNQNKMSSIGNLTSAEKEAILNSELRNIRYGRINFTQLISGGYRLSDNPFTKYIVSIRTITVNKYFGDNHFCGGTIIKPWAILTAAHCLKAHTGFLSSWELRVVAGTPIRMKRTQHTRVHLVESVHIHPQYNNRKVVNDIAILILKKPYIAEDGKYAQCARMTKTLPRPGETCTVLGWGRIYNNGPLANEIVNVDVEIWHNKKCYNQVPLFRNGMLCAGSNVDPDRDACTGDSGGPMFCNGSLTGIVSFGWGCGTAGFPGVYTDIWYFRKWIAENNAYKLNVSSHILLLFFISYICTFVVNIVFV